MYIGGFLYISLRINATLRVHFPYNAYIVGAALLIAIIGMSSMIFRRGDYSFMQILGPLGFICMGCFAITITVFILIDIISIPNLFLKIPNFRYYAIWIAIILSAILCISALLNVAFIQKIKKVTVKMDNLPVQTLKVAAIADLHINAWTSPKSINKIFDKVQSLNPDIIVIVGDVIDVDINKNDRFLEYGFSKLKAPQGVFVVTGNHEYYTGVKAFYDMFNKIGAKALKNESVLAGEIINIAGIEDINWNNQEIILKSLSNTDNKYPTIFLSHRPESFNIAQQKEVFQISGHTHAGQIPPIWIARNFFMQYNYGFYKKGKSTMYITSGVRWWGPPMRLFNTCEIVLITIEKG
jgi:predicted MPP superfamily phosphohydrolase